MLVYYKLAQEARTVIYKESAKRDPLETGGILIGRVLGSCVWIEYATGPGPAAHHSPRHFRRDGQYSQIVLDKLVAQSGGKYDYIGEWHSHPSPSAPSSLDVTAMRWIANNKKYAVKQPIMILCTKVSANVWELTVYFFDGRRLREVKPQAISPRS